MRSFSLRVRITALVVGASALTLVLVGLLGAASSVDTVLAEETLESANEALNETDGPLTDYVNDLQNRIENWADGTAGDSFNDWRELPGLNVAVLDQQGNTRSFDLEAPLTVFATHRCRSANGNVQCETEGPLASPQWGLELIEERTKKLPFEVPIVLHGFVVEGAGGEQRLIRLETDVFAAGEVEVSSGFEDLAIVALPVLLVLLGAITWFSLGRALSPVEAMSGQVNQIGADNLDQRVPVPEADDELQHLALTMNRMLDRLQQASENQRQFISDASHELRSPITATGATLEVARANPDGADWEHVAGVIEEENSRLGSLVDDLLILARLDEDRSQRAADVVDLEEICLAEAQRAHPVQVSVRVLAPARVTGDLATLTRAVRNLVDNAAAHADSVVQIEVDGSGDDAIGDYAVIRINDDGPGIPADQAERIFERFVRIDESRNRTSGGGAGLGLAIVKGIAEAHGGTVALDTTSSNGSSFSLKLPL